jgi:hypothetical protein
LCLLQKGGILAHDWINSIGIIWDVVWGEDEVMILIRGANRQVGNHVDSKFHQSLGLTNSTALEDNWRTKCTGRDNDELASLDNTRSLVGALFCIFVPYNFDSGGLVSVKNDTDNLGRGKNVQMFVVGKRVDVSVRSILSVSSL